MSWSTSSSSRRKKVATFFETVSSCDDVESFQAVLWHRSVQRSTPAPFIFCTTSGLLTEYPEWPVRFSLCRSHGLDGFRGTHFQGTKAPGFEGGASGGRSPFTRVKLLCGWYTLVVAACGQHLLLAFIFNADPPIVSSASFW